MFIEIVNLCCFQILFYYLNLIVLNFDLNALGKTLKIFWFSDKGRLRECWNVKKQTISCWKVLFPTL